MKRLNEYKRMTKGILSKMLEEAKQGLRAFEIVSSYKYTEYCNDTEQIKNSIMSIERIEYLIKDLEMFSFIQLRIQSNGDLNIYYHSNENLTIKEIETIEEKEVVQTEEVIEEVQEIVNVTEKKYFVGREVEGKMEALAYQTGYGVHWTEDLSSETVGIYTLEEITEKMKWISNSKATIQEVKQEIAPEATKEEITATEEIEVIETTITFRTAENAFRGISHTPEDRAKSIIKSSNKEIKVLIDDLIAINPTEKENIISDVKEWAKSFDNKKSAWLSAMSRVASSMITGPANFPVERNRKRMETAEKRNEELLEWLQRSKKALIKKYSPKPKEKNISDFIEEAKNECKEYTKEQLSGFAKVLIKDRLMRKLVNYANLSLENLKEAQEIAKQETFFFTANHKIHRTLSNINSKFNRIEEGTANKETEINNIKIVDSEENNRIEIYFNGKPSEEIRKYLKSKAWKWSPTKGAWQNFRNNQRLIDIKKFIETIAQ